ncbi:MAG TPA: Ppx/GppA phosphatase family protein [Candidatus Acidoferrales bacterium]|nr:Ppx/GppA phosphatase family protein [Candidatus Acidoferrales bacterium]
MAEPIHIAAMDAGSNALRFSIARSLSPLDIEVLSSERIPVRLGENAFTEQRIGEETLSLAAQAFRDFRAKMNEFGVTAYRAVATSAAREARNRRALVSRVQRAAGIRLEVISEAEESRLGRTAVLAALGHERAPRVIIDLGGGSLELSILQDGLLENSVQLPVGAVRLMETLGLAGPMRPKHVEQVRRYVRALLESRLPRRPDLSGGMAAVCGGNAEALAQIAPGPREGGFRSLDLSRLRAHLTEIVERDVPGRMKAFGVRRDRADVMGIAAVILLALGRFLNLRVLLVPGVGVRDGLLQDLAHKHFARQREPRYDAAARELLTAVRWYARRLDSDQHHSEHVRELARMLFDQLRPVHGLPAESRLLLEAAALLHDIGHIVNHRGHHKHGEYLVRNADIAGLAGEQRQIVACLVRYHNRKSEPAGHHAGFGALDAPQRRCVRALAALLRIAEGFDHSHQQNITRIEVSFKRGEIGLRAASRGDAAEDIRDAERGAALFEREYGVRVFIRQAMASSRVA